MRLSDRLRHELVLPCPGDSCVRRWEADGWSFELAKPLRQGEAHALSALGHGRIKSVTLYLTDAARADWVGLPDPEVTRRARQLLDL